jgi:carbamate kinase
MGPKAAAAARFASRTGRRAAIGSLADAVALAAGDAGTQVRPAPAAVR